MGEAAVDMGTVCLLGFGACVAAFSGTTYEGEESGSHAVRVLAEGVSCLAPRYGMFESVEIARERIEERIVDVETFAEESDVPAILADLFLDCNDYADVLEEHLWKEGIDPKEFLRRIKG